VNFIPTPIQKVVEDGIITEDGKKREVDVIICATGFDECDFVFSQPVWKRLTKR
jgi:cation diffusion facilitator CzcD-associated flavoprotein CzcO